MPVSNAYVDTVLEQFLGSGRLAQNLVRTPIAESWMRCYRDGVGADSCGPRSSRPRSIRDHLRGRDFVRAGLRIVEEARDVLSHSESIAVLADSRGIVR